MKGKQKRAIIKDEHLKKEVNQQINEKMQKTSKTIAEEGLLPQNAIGISESMVEGLYAQAYRLYNTGQYDDAGQIFRMLLGLNPTQPKYAMGLAATYHLRKMYENAVELYQMAAILDPKNPLPHYHSSDCFLKLNDSLSAIISLEMTLSRAEGKKQFQTLYDRANMTLQGLKKELKERGS